MDLNVLFAGQVTLLQQCYAELGHEPQRLQQALQAAIDSEVERTQAEVEDAKAVVEELRRRCQLFKDILASDGAEAAASSSGSGPRFYEGTFLARIEAWQGEVGRLERQYVVRRAHVDRQLETLDAYRPILGDFVPVIEGSGAAAYQRQHASALDACGTSTLSPTSASIPTPIPNLQAVEAALAACTIELKRRNEVLNADAAEVAQLWAELALLPNAEDKLDQGILQHLQIAPRLVDVGDGCFDFCGEFEEAPAHGDGVEDDAGDGVCETPTRVSGSYHQLSGPTTLVKPHNLAPTNEILHEIVEKREQLEAEKTQRTDRLQAVYDELVPLWRRFDVADEDVDAFVQANCGCTLPVLEAYESELNQMLELKSQHMALFISKVREDIAELWDQLMMSTEERQDSFAPFFYDLADVGGEIAGGVEPSDELLSLHEEKVRELGDDLASRARPLELVRQYTRLLEEAAELEASAKDISRLTGRGAPGQRRDPGRLLREEKMRKRIKCIKPKIEEELVRTIPAWEEEAGRPFVVNGQRFLDTVNLNSPVSPKKRQRTASQNQASAQGAAAVATPQSASSKRANLNGSQQRSASANGTTLSSAAKKTMQPPSSANPPRSASNASSQSRLRQPQQVSRPQSALGVMGPPPTSMRKPSNTQSGHASQQRVASAASSVSSQSSHSSNAKTGVLGISTHAANGAQANDHQGLAAAKKGPALHHGAAGTRQASANHKRPSMLLEASFRNAPRPSADYIKPTQSGAGATLKTPGQYRQQAGFISAKAQQHHAAGANVEDSVGPNWAVLDEDDENLLMF